MQFDFDALTKRQKFGLLIEFLSHSEDQDPLMLVFEQEKDRICVFKTDKYEFTREKALVHVPLTTIDSFGRLRHSTQFELILIFFTKCNVVDDIKFCYCCNKRGLFTFRSFRERYFKCRVRGCKATFCADCNWREFPHAKFKRRNYLMTCYRHETLYNMLMKN